MTLSPLLLLGLYCVAIAGFSLVGGQLPHWVRMTHTRTQLAMSLVSGLMLGVAFFHLLPHSLALQGDADAADVSMGWLMLGLVVTLLLLRFFQFHSHDHDSSASRTSGPATAAGFGVHTLIDGVALGAALHGEHLAGAGMTGAGMTGAGMTGAGLAGVGVFLAILLHKPLDAMAITTIMTAGGWSRKITTANNIVFALLCPLGAFVFFLGVGLLGDATNEVVAAALAFSAGTFICIALSDLLPEVQFHRHDRIWLTLVFLCGVGLAYGIGVLEPAHLHLPGG